MKPWLTVKEAALVVGRHERNIYRWIEAGRLTAHTDADGILMVFTADVQKVEPLVKRGRPRGSVSTRRHAARDRLA